MLQGGGVVLSIMTGILFVVIGRLMKQKRLVMIKV